MAEIHGDFQQLPLDAIHDAVAAPLDGRGAGKDALEGDRLGLVRA